MKEYKNEIEKIDNSINPTVQNQLRDVFGNIEVVDTAPTEVPVRLDQQIKLYANGSTYRLYLYDTLNGAWRYSSLT
jgi:hypothetical protein